MHKNIMLGVYMNMSLLAFTAGAQSDSELSSHHPSEVSLDRGYTSDSEVYTEHSKTRIPRSATDVDVASSGWLVVSTHTHTCFMSNSMLHMTLKL